MLERKKYLTEHADDVKGSIGDSMAQYGTLRLVFRHVLSAGRTTASGRKKL
jgi:hypothetical protein